MSDKDPKLERADDSRNQNATIEPNIESQSAINLESQGSIAQQEDE